MGCASSLLDARVRSPVAVSVRVACREERSRFKLPHPHPICAHRRAAIADEDEDEMNEVQPEAVPAEVREWLASTFSRTSAVQLGGGRGIERRRFKSVVNAVRAGLLVDRIYRRTFSGLGLQYPAAVVSSLKVCTPRHVLYIIDIIIEGSLHRLSVRRPAGRRRRLVVQPVRVQRAHREPRAEGARQPPAHVLRYPRQTQGVCVCICLAHPRTCRKHTFTRGAHGAQISQQVLDAFLATLETGYSKFGNPYHNLVHAADVTATSNFFISKFKLVVRLASCLLPMLSSSSSCSALVARSRSRCTAELALGAGDLRHAVRRAHPRLRAHRHHQHVPHQLLVRPAALSAFCTTGHPRIFRIFP